MPSHSALLSVNAPLKVRANVVMLSVIMLSVMAPPKVRRVKIFAQLAPDANVY
jgi:hypothetical protein